MLIQKHTKNIFYVLVVAATLASGGAQAWGFDGVILKEALEPGEYCHLKFPAIEPGTLGSAHPRLKSPDSSDVIDYYGSCDHDPLGKDEVQTQMREEWQWENRDG